MGARPCAILNIGLWDGAVLDGRGGLLYRTLLQSARAHRVRGGTVWRAVEGGRAALYFRSIESEVSSNDLPVWIAFVDSWPALQGWLPVCRELVGECGVIVVERGYMWAPGDRPQGGSTVIRNAEWSGTPDPRAEPAWDGLEVQVFTLERNQVGGKPVHQAAAEFLRRQGVLWISTTRGLLGYGAQLRMHEARWWFQKDDVPVVLTALDRVDKLAGCLPELAAFVGDAGLVVSKPVVWHHPR